MGISVWKLLLIVLIVLLVFGSGRLRNVGADLAGAIRNFRAALGHDSKDNTESKNSNNKD
ncbi:MAG: twin-arginine translocase TatA/TatE family subunit [Gammaproteobacteria bacterium]